MLLRHDPIRCIIPPHILRALADNRDRRLREIALRALAASSRLRGRRDILGRMMLGAATEEEHRSIYDAQNGVRLPGKLVRGEGDPPASDPAANEAYDGLGATYTLYHDVFQRNSIDDHGLRLDASVHYDEKFDNAFWDGRQMIFGDGDGVLFVGFTKAIDVIGHELTHGVTQYTANLEYHTQAGALNESFSDVFGSLVKQYHLGQDAHTADWLIGDGILAPGINGKALRSMKEPGAAYDDPKLGGKDPQPGQMDGYVDLPDTDDGDNGGVHINSGIPNHAFYLVADQLGGNAWDDAGHIWYETLRRLWPTAQFQDCANVSFQVAGELFGAGSSPQQAVKTAWGEVGITVATQPVGPRREKPPQKRRAAAEVNGAQLKRELERMAQQLRRVIEAIP